MGGRSGACKGSEEAIKNKREMWGGVIEVARGREVKSERERDEEKACRCFNDRIRC